jgi:hypothetical protein
MKPIALAVVILLGGCAAQGLQSGGQADACKAEIDRLNAQLATEVAERQRLVRAAGRREDLLRRQLDAMKSIERGILERDDRRTETR